MTEFHLLYNPTKDEIVEACMKSLNFVQMNAKNRLLTAPADQDYETILFLPQGVININGCRPSNAEDTYITGQTSRLGFAWWTDKNGFKIVHVLADRTTASNFSVPDLFNKATHPFLLVFPNHTSTCFECDYHIPPGEGNWIDGLKCDVCVEQDLYLKETGFLPPGNRKKRTK